MIASVTGRVASVTGEAAVVEVGGVGVAVQLSPATAAGLRVGENVRLATALVVREDSLTLYGFADDDSRAVFEVLQSVSGVGPRLAQAILSVHAPDAIRAAVATDDLAALCLVPGIGRKSAQRLILELKDRLGAAGAPGPVVTLPAGRSTDRWRPALRTALLGLGWSAREVEEALAAVAADAEAALAAGEEPDVAALLKACLQGLSRV